MVNQHESGHTIQGKIIDNISTYENLHQLRTRNIKTVRNKPSLICPVICGRSRL